MMQSWHGHRKLFQRFHRPGDYHELTFSCYQRMALLSNDLWRAKLSHGIDDACARLQIELAAFVFMPEHLHLLVFPIRAEPQLEEFLAEVKQPLAHFVKRCLLESGSQLHERLTIPERPGINCFRFWQEGPGFDRNLFKPKAIEASINYIHNNPVVRKLCSRPVDWKWSNARYYLLDPPRQQFADLPVIHGLRREALELGLGD